MVDTLNAIAPLLEIKDERFDPKRCAEYELLMELGAERLRFLVLDGRKKRVLYLEDYLIGGLPSEKKWSTWLAKLSEQHPFWASNLWKSVTVSFNTPHFTLIPEAYFRKEYLNSYLSLVQGELFETDQILHHEVKRIGARNVFTVNKELWEWVLNTYTLQVPAFVHQTNALIEGALELSGKDKESILLDLHFEDDFVTLVIVQNDSLLMCNKFAYKTAADMAYFIMFVLDSLQLKPGEVKCHFYGETTPYSEDYQLLQKFLPYLSFGKTPEKLVVGSAFEDVPEHRYYSLYTILFAS